MGKKVKKLRFQFVILTAGEYAGQKLFLTASQKVYSNNGQTSWLYNIIKHLRSEPTGDEQDKGVSGDTINALIGNQCIVMVNCSTGKNGKTYSNIKGMTPAKELLPSPKLNTKGPVAVPELPDEENAPQTFNDDEDLPPPPADGDLPF